MLAVGCRGQHPFAHVQGSTGGGGEAELSEGEAHTEAAMTATASIVFLSCYQATWTFHTRSSNNCQRLDTLVLAVICLLRSTGPPLRASGELVRAWCAICECCARCRHVRVFRVLFLFEHCFVLRNHREGGGGWCRRAFGL